MPKRMQIVTLLDGRYPLVFVARPDASQPRLWHLLHWFDDEDDARAYVAEREELDARGRT